MATDSLTATIAATSNVQVYGPTHVFPRQLTATITVTSNSNGWPYTLQVLGAIQKIPVFDSPVDP